MRLISVVMGAKRMRFASARAKLLTGAFAFETVIPIKANAPFTQQRVWFGDSKEVNLGVEKDVALTIPKGQMKNLKASFTLSAPQLQAPLKSISRWAPSIFS